MTFIKELIDREFFIIDSNNLDSVETSFYGYSISDNNIIRDSVKVDNLDSIGSYVYVEVNDNEISINQDFMGSYGLYLYTDEDYFAISNSFLKLVEYLKNTRELSFNQDFADSLLIPRLLCSFAFGETLVNEIECVERNKTIKINKNSLNIKFEEIDFKENSVDVDTAEGLEILDGWFEKWISIIRALKQKTNNIYFDLSGGFDTRVVCSLLVSSGIDLNSINVNSIDDDKHNHEEDFEIASQIGEEYGFKLNQKKMKDNKIAFDDIGDIVSLSSYVKLGFSNQFNYKTYYSSNPFFVINGYGGECIRGFPKGTIGEYKDKLKASAKKYNPSFEQSVDRIMTSGIDKVKLICENDDYKLNWRYYKETRLRNHFGKGAVESVIVNRIPLSPLIDPDLFRLNINTSQCDDELLLITLILYRYCPKLLDFKVEGGRKFNEKTIEIVKRINEIKPYHEKSFEIISEVEENLKDNNACDIIAAGEIDGYIEEVFRSPAFEHEFKKYIRPSVYESIIDSIDSHYYLPTRDILPALSIVKLHGCVDCSKSYDFSRWMDLFYRNDISNQDISFDCRKLLKKYATARIDIKNQKDKENKVEIMEISDFDSKITSPGWFRDYKGEGKIITSTKGNLKVKLKCIKDGKLNIKLRGTNAFDKDKNRFPIYIDFIKFTVNGENVIDESKLLCLDKSYVYSKDVDDGQTVDLEFEWMPFNKNSSYESEIDSLKEQLKKSESKNRDLEDKLNRIADSKYGKLISKFVKL